MAIFSVKNVIEQNVEDLWGDVLDPANWIDGLGLYYDFYYKEMPLKFADQQSLGFKIRRYRIEKDWLINVKIDLEQKEVQFLQTRGPFKHWKLITRVSEHGEGQSVIQQIMNYEMPLSIVGSLLDDLYIKSEIEEQIQHFQSFLR